MEGVGGGLGLSLLLCIETSCDDTSAAVVEIAAEATTIRSSIVSSQHEFHAAFGGVVPEVASRRHTELLVPAVAAALADAGAGWDDLDAVAVTTGPGLIGALLVGLAAAKAIAYARRLPLTPVDHLQGHLAAAYALGVEAPFVCLTASGGHTLLAVVEHGVEFRVVGRTLDDAAGEAFDKGARMLGLGYPGGAALERLAADGDPEAFSFPGSRGERSRGGRGTSRQAFARSLDFSFAGLKTALLYRLRECSESEVQARRADLAAAYQAAIVDSLILRAEQALEQTGIGRLAVGGGVAANGELRRRLSELDAALHVPPRVLCTDNAAMIASAARFTRALRYPEYLGLDVYATGEQPNISQARAVTGSSIL